MKRQPFYPELVPAQPGWLRNFADKLPTYAAIVGIANDLRDAAVADALWLAYLIGLWRPAAQAWADTIAKVIAEGERGTGTGAMVLPIFVPPPLPGATATLPATVPVEPGALDRLLRLIKNVKNARGCTDAICTDLGIVGTQPSPETHPVPRFKLHVGQGVGCQNVRIKFYKYGRTGVCIESRRNGGKWESLALAIISPCLDERPLLVPGAAEIREYRMRYLDKNLPTGDWTAVQKVTVAP